MKIPFRTITPKADMQIGFDAQINDAKDGIRISVANWNDVSGNGYCGYVRVRHPDTEKVTC